MPFAPPAKGGTDPTTVKTASAAGATQGPGGFLSGLDAISNKLSEPYNKMTEPQKKRYEFFSKMAVTPAPQPQFSPAQFRGAGDPTLLAVVEELKKRGIK